MEKEINITLCDKILNGDIPRYKFKRINDAFGIIVSWLNEKDFEDSVFVCFENNRGLPMEELRNEQTSLFISHSFTDIMSFVERNILINNNIDFAIFEFEDYQNALRYCIDLKESF